MNKLKVKEEIRKRKKVRGTVKIWRKIVKMKENYFWGKNEKILREKL
jgi:hypothetical protein